MRYISNVTYTLHAIPLKYNMHIILQEKEIPKHRKFLYQVRYLKEKVGGEIAHN